MTWRSRGAHGLAIGLLCLVGGCSLGGDDDESPEPARGAPRAVAALVSKLERATRASDWRAVCGDLFSRAARERAGGKDCPRLLRSAAGELRGTQIDVTKLTIKPGYIDALVRTRARGQPPLTDTLRIVRERGRYRIDSVR